MAYEQRDNTGSLFKNDKRETEDQPQARGSAMIDGVEYWVSAWTNVSQKTGERWQKLSFQRKEPAQAAPPRKGRPEPERDNWDDPVPF